MRYYNELEDFLNVGNPKTGGSWPWLLPKSTAYYKVLEHLGWGATIRCNRRNVDETSSAKFRSPSDIFNVLMEFISLVLSLAPQMPPQLRTLLDLDIVQHAAQFQCI